MIPNVVFRLLNQKVLWYISQWLIESKGFLRQTDPHGLAQALCAGERHGLTVPRTQNLPGLLSSKRGGCTPFGLREKTKP